MPVRLAQVRNHAIHQSLESDCGFYFSELVGEIRDFIPSAKVTVVQKDCLPLNATYPDALRRRIASEIEARGTRLILNDSVTLSQSVLDGTDPVTPGRKITTAGGVTIPADLIVRPTVFLFRHSPFSLNDHTQVATGGRRGVNTGFLTPAISPSAPGIGGSLNAEGSLRPPRLSNSRRTQGSLRPVTLWLSRNNTRSPKPADMPTLSQLTLSL